MNRYDKASSLLWLAASVIITVGSSAYSFGSWSHPGPAFLPLLCGLSMVVFSLIIFIQSLGKIRPEGEGAGSFFTPLWPRLAVALTMLLAYTFLLEPLGFILTTFIFMLGVLRWIGKIRWATALLVAFIATAASYGLFDRLLKVQMPPGFWGSLF
jgi:putative tricarboxylic transport membrane protein